MQQRQGLYNIIICYLSILLRKQKVIYRSQFLSLDLQTYRLIDKSHLFLYLL